MGGAAEDWAEFHPDAVKKLEESKAAADLAERETSAGDIETFGAEDANDEN
ncbi:hypothetical protein [Microbacterium sp. PMB16]|uniref:hypothetical protein n=1 Tax=Microbacterium sp. PMB16 TaxID=3120157 RepID=UPI003F4BA4DB